MHLPSPKGGAVSAAGHAAAGPGAAPPTKDAGTCPRIGDATLRVAEAAWDEGRTVIHRSDGGGVAWTSAVAGRNPPERALKRGFQTYQAVGSGPGRSLEALRRRQPCAVPTRAATVRPSPAPEGSDLWTEVQRAQVRYSEAVHVGSRVAACVDGSPALVERARAAETVLGASRMPRWPRRTWSGVAGPIGAAGAALALFGLAEAAGPGSPPASAVQSDHAGLMRWRRRRRPRAWDRLRAWTGERLLALADDAILSDLATPPATTPSPDRPAREVA